MTAARWKETESKVHNPISWFVLVIGAVFLLIGTMCYLARDEIAGAKTPKWFVPSFAAAFALLGGLAIACAIWSIKTVWIRHAHPDVLPHVPREPKVVDGASARSYMKWELAESSTEWRLRPSRKRLRDQKRFVFGFGLPFMMVFAAGLSWIFHSQHGLSWLMATFIAIFVTIFCGGLTFGLIYFELHSEYQDLPHVTIPKGKEDLLVESPMGIDTGSIGLTSGCPERVSGNADTEELVIPREIVRGVQLCAWKLVWKGGGDRATTWVVQGMLILGLKEEMGYDRLPILVTDDLVGAARLMQSLGVILDVPYLYCADKESWRTEALRAKLRPPLRHGG